MPVSKLPTASPEATFIGAVTPVAPYVQIAGPPGYGSGHSLSGSQVQAANVAGAVTLPNYWLATDHVRRGQTLSVDYVIDNATGAAAHLMLGASIKSIHTRGWSSDAINDPAHDVVALVPPGLSLHMRYFTVPARLPPGLYDMAWGLRDAETGRAVALVSVPVLGVRR